MKYFFIGISEINLGLLGDCVKILIQIDYSMSIFAKASSFDIFPAKLESLVNRGIGLVSLINQPKIIT